MEIALCPLDERPVNTRYPQMIAAIAGAQLHLPPPEIRGRQRVPADTDAVAAWLDAQVGTVDGIVASVEFLAWGNLIHSRISHETTQTGLGRLAPLVRAADAGAIVYAFVLITRVSNADDCVEEPLFWKQWGTRLYRLSQLLHKESAGALEPVEAQTLAALRAEIPAEHVRDFLIRRERNHALNLGTLNLLAREKLAFLLLTSDDTSPWGLPSREKAWLESWIDLLGEPVRSRTMVHPGADEVGSALVARLLCAREATAFRLFPLYAIAGDEEIVAPYEDRAVRLTVEGQIRACGGCVVDQAEDADLVLGVLTPSPRRTEWRADFADAERAAREGQYRTFFTRLGDFQRAGLPVALGDVAYPNGADPLAMELLLAPDCPLVARDLRAFGAWNTAGNSLGTTVAQAVASLLPGADPAALRLALAHHFLEGWGYQSEVRREARQANRAAWGHHDPDPDNPEQIAFACHKIEAGLAVRLARLQSAGIGTGLSLAPGSVRLPWNRTFEVDFDLTLT